VEFDLCRLREVSMTFCGQTVYPEYPGVNLVLWKDNLMHKQ
jgi:hypothetical protein